MASEFYTKESATDWGLLAQLSIRHREGGWMAWFHLHPLLTVCARGRMRVFLRGDWMAVSLRIVEFRARPPTPSSWPCADASQKPLHSLTLLSPSSHGLTGQNPAIVPPRGVHRLANSPAHTHTRHVRYVQMDSKQQHSIPEPVEKKTKKRLLTYHIGFFFFFFTSWIVLQLFPQFAPKP